MNQISAEFRGPSARICTSVFCYFAYREECTARDAKNSFFFFFSVVEEKSPWSSGLQSRKCPTSQPIVLWLVSIHYCSRVITVANRISRSGQDLLGSVPAVVSMTFTADFSRTKLRQQQLLENFGFLKIQVYNRRDFCQAS